MKTLKFAFVLVLALVTVAIIACSSFMCGVDMALDYHVNSFFLLCVYFAPTIAIGVSMYKAGVRFGRTQNLDRIGDLEDDKTLLEEEIRELEEDFFQIVEENDQLNERVYNLEDSMDCSCESDDEAVE